MYIIFALCDVFSWQIKHETKHAHPNLGHHVMALECY